MPWFLNAAVGGVSEVEKSESEFTELGVNREIVSVRSVVRAVRASGRGEAASERGPC